MFWQQLFFSLLSAVSASAASGTKRTYEYTLRATVPKVTLKFYSVKATVPKATVPSVKCYQ